MLFLIYWIVEKIDIGMDLDFRSKIIENMFSKDWLFPNATKTDTISVIDMNNKFISMIMSIPVQDNKTVFMELETDDNILNTIYNED